jgi:outer membrane protein assembly factor BamB
MMHTPRAVHFLSALLFLVLVSPLAIAGDWPMFRADPARSASVAEELPDGLRLAWVRHCVHAPAPAWPRVARMSFDRAHQPVIAGGRIFFGDTVDCAVRALELETGRQLWHFDTEGPVRFAPVVFEGRVYVGSDDGFLYCLDSADGTQLWKVRGGGDERLVLGNERMISRWPVRGGPVIADGVLYFAAGIWPSEGIYVHALEARTGRPIWVNDDSGTIFMAQPHGGAEAESGVGAQGHLVITDDHLLVPNGRGVPAAFRRSDGAFEYFHLQRQSPSGGTATMASGKYFFNSGSFFDAKSGAPSGKTGAVAIAGLPDGIATATRTAIAVYRWGEIDPATGTQGLEKRHEIACAATDGALVAVGEKLVAGGEGRVVVIDLEAGDIAWTHPVEGIARALAVSDGRLLVGTDTGDLYCFDGVAREAEDIYARFHIVPHSGYGGGDLPSIAAAEIIEKSGVREGYCLDLGAGDGGLSRELARATELHIIAVEPDPDLAAIARANLAHDGLLGTRVSVVQCPLDELKRLPSYFADLIVSYRLVRGDSDFLAGQDLERLQRPCGGIRCLGEPGAFEVQRRGPLPDTGDWTHLYADPGNTSCSGDAVRGPLGMLWFREIAQDLPQRHGRGPSPLYYDGRIFSLGLDSLIAVDAYNGRLIWEHPFPGILHGYDGDHLMGISGTHGMYCVDEEGVFVRQGARCYRVDRKTGEQLSVYELPGEDSRGLWGYLACDDGVLYGSRANPDHVVTYRYLKGGDLSVQLTESNAFFALDVESGELRWMYEAEHSLRHNAIAIGGGRVFLIDRPLAEVDLPREEGVESKDLSPHLPGTLVCLDARTGRKRWSKEEDVFGTLLALSAERDALLMSYQSTRFQLESEVGGRLTVFDARNGKRRWEEKVRYDSRPLIVDRTVYWQTGARDLLTGEPRPFQFSRSYGCGILAAGLNLLVYRSATLGYFELDRDEGTENYGGIRPGCWINALPAGGLVLLPDASTGCVCSYLNRSWIALQPEPLRWPTVEPSGGAFREPVRVELRAEEKGARVHYTLDGTTPTEESPLYRRPVLVEESGKLKLRSFSRKAFPSRVVSADFLIDPLLLPLEKGNWSIWDCEPPVNSPPSAWRVAGGVVTQSSNIFSPVAEIPESAVQPLYGTLYIYERGKRFTDGVLRLQIRSADNDGIGVAFRLRDARHHYLLSINQERKFRTLAVRDGDEYRILARDAVTYSSGQWFDVRIEMDGHRYRVSIDGELAFEVEDETYREGGVALHSWGATGVEFRRIALERE